MARTTGTRGLRWPLQFNSRGGVELTDGSRGGREELRQTIAVAHLPRRSADPYLHRDSVGAPDVAFAPVSSGKPPARLLAHIKAFYARMAARGRAQLTDGPTFVAGEPNTGKVEVHETVINLESGAVEEVSL